MSDETEKRENKPEIIGAGESVILVLQNPREKIVGILQEIGGSGLFLRGVDLNYFDEWMRAIKNGEIYLPMQSYFFPMWRVERLMYDHSSPEIPSHKEIFEQRTGHKFDEF